MEPTSPPPDTDLVFDLLEARGGTWAIALWSDVAADLGWTVARTKRACAILAADGLLSIELESGGVDWYLRFTRRVPA